MTQQPTVEPEPSRPNWGCFWSAILIPALVVAVFAYEYATVSHRYRLTVEIDTPDGVRSGASVIEVKRYDERLIPGPGPSFSFQVRGEAAFIDLGGGRNVIALLAHGPLAENVGIINSLAIQAYGYSRSDERAWAGRMAGQGPVELKPPLIPTLVTFTDLNDPTTAQVVYATQLDGSYHKGVVAVDRFAEVFGPDVRLRRATVELVSTGTWPFTSLGWPQSLAGVPVTTGIEQKLPWWNGPFPWLKPVGGDVFVDTRKGGFRSTKMYFKRGF